MRVRERKCSLRVAKNENKNKNKKEKWKGIKSKKHTVCTRYNRCQQAVRNEVRKDELLMNEYLIKCLYMYILQLFSISNANIDFILNNLK